MQLDKVSSFDVCQNEVYSPAERPTKLWKDLSWCQRTKLIALALAGVPASTVSKKSRAAYRAAEGDHRDAQVMIDIVDGYDSEGDRVDGILDPTDYTERLSCKPPPLFLPIISLVQVGRDSLFCRFCYNFFKQCYCY